MTALWGGGGGSRGARSYSTTSCPSQETTVPSHEGVWGGRGRRMTLTLTDHCSMTVLPFYEGSKDDKVGLKICFFALLHVWLCHVLSLYKDTFLCSMQIYSAWSFYDIFFNPPPPRLLTESAAHSRDFSFFPFSVLARVSAPARRTARRRT